MHTWYISTSDVATTRAARVRHVVPKLDDHILIILSSPRFASPLQTHPPTHSERARIRWDAASVYPGKAAAARTLPKRNA